MKSEPVLGFDAELHISAKWVIAGMLIAAIAVLFASDEMQDAGARNRVILIGVLLYAWCPLAWFLDDWQPWAGRAFMIVGMIAAVVLARYWLDVPGTLALMAAPAGLAAAMMGLPAAAATAIGESVLLLLLSGRAATTVSDYEVAVALAATWALFAVMSAVYQPMYQLDRWLWQYLKRAQRLLDESLDRKAELAQALADLGHANRQLALANERLATLRAVAEEAQKSKASFVARVSHEFRTPLNMIIGLVGIMVENPEVYAEDFPPDLWQDLQIVHRNCQHLSGMINDVLDLSQAEMGRLVLHPDWVDMAEVVDHVIEAVRPMADKKRLVIDVSVAEDLPAVYCDRTRIRQVLLNLVSNAARFTQKGGIAVHLAREEEHVLLSVADTGPGISPQDRERVFEPFYQGKQDRMRAGEGSGLGLSISRQLVQLHGGRMWLESELGVGTRFFFTLPMSPLPELAERPERWIMEDWVWQEHAFKTSRAYSVAQLSRPRLVVCDETGGLESLSRYADDVEVVRVEDLARAAEVLHECPAHALIVNAAESARLLGLVQQAQQDSDRTPVIGCSVPRPVVHALESGALRHLIKPVTQADLQGALRTIEGPIRQVLVVDDEPEVLGLWTRMLHVYDAAIEVTAASSGRQALDMLSASRPDLVFLDIVMPEMDGWQVLEQMGHANGSGDGRGDGRGDSRGEIPVVIVSAQDPADQPLSSEMLLASIGQGISLPNLLRCSLSFSSLLLGADREPQPALG
jgi:signal transduction histidine kinase/CheY-like chemotaxis protein